MLLRIECVFALRYLMPRPNFRCPLACHILNSIKERSQGCNPIVFSEIDTTLSGDDVALIFFLGLLTKTVEQIISYYSFKMFA